MPTAYLGNVRTGKGSIWWISCNSFCPQCQSEKARLRSWLKCLPVGFMPTKIVSHGQDFHPWKKTLLGISFRGWTFLDSLSGTGGEHELTWLLKLFLLKNFIRLWDSWGQGILGLVVSFGLYPSYLPSVRHVWQFIINPLNPHHKTMWCYVIIFILQMTELFRSRA